MKYKNKYVRNNEEYLELRKIANCCFDLESNLPQQVFKTHFTKFFFEEFDWLLTEDFWNDIRKSKRSNESKLIFGVLSPDSDNYFYKHFGFYNWLVLDSKILSNEYLEILKVAPNNNLADAIYYNSNIVIIYPLSLEWAIWGDRRYGTCILGIDEINCIDNSFVDISSWKTYVQAKYWISLNLFKSINKQHILTLFKKNYV